MVGTLRLILGLCGVGALVVVLAVVMFGVVVFVFVFAFVFVFLSTPPPRMERAVARAAAVALAVAVTAATGGPSPSVDSFLERPRLLLLPVAFFSTGGRLRDFRSLRSFSFLPRRCPGDIDADLVVFFVSVVLVVFVGGTLLSRFVRLRSLRSRRSFAAFGAESSGDASAIVPPPDDGD